MKNVWVTILMLVITLTVQAQMPVSVVAGNTKSVANLGHIYGKITDGSNKALSDVSVIVMQQRLDTVTKKTKEVMLKGAVTESNGDFDFEDLPLMGKVSIKISVTGYQLLTQSVSFLSAEGKPALRIDLGNIKLTPAVAQLADVTVVATKPLLKLDADKKVFNVEKNLVSAGGTAVDIMKNVPSVQVDIDGNVKLRNSAPQLFIDGRVTTLTLEQIPADAIESVEVITNPSAKYDASGGGAGILNIVLKKNKKQGYNGSVRVGMNQLGGGNGGIDLNLRQEKFNLTASVNGRLISDKSTGTTSRLDLFNIPQTQYNQLNTGKTNGGMLFSRLGVDYFASNRTTFSLNGFLINANFKPGDVNDIFTDSLLNSGKISSFSQRISATDRGFTGKGVAMGIKHLFPTTGEELTFDANYFSGNNAGNSVYTTNYFASRVMANTQLQKVLSNGTDQNLLLQADYVKPINAVTKIETGVRASLRSRVTNNYNYLFNTTLATDSLVPSATSNYTNADNVYAAYATVSSRIKNFSYKIGLRAERSSYSGELKNGSQTFSNQYPISLFPSVFLSQKLSADQDIQASYTRRVNRPNFFQLIPFVDYTDKLNITKGNPNLVPEFTQSFEVSYMKRFTGNNSLLASVYYKTTDNLITRYIDQQIDPVTGATILINSYVNAHSSYATGVELTSINYLTKWWDISTNLNLYQSKVTTGNPMATQQEGMWSWFGKFTSNFKLPSNYSVQLSAMYQSKTNLPVNGNPGMMGPPGMQLQSASQGYMQSFYGVDLAIKKTFGKDNAASLVLSVNDIFKTRVQAQYAYSDYFIQNSSRLRNPQMVQLTFAYRFGKIDMNLFKRKSSGAMQAGSESMQQ